MLATDADFASEIRLNPTVAVDANFVFDGFGSTGVHVTINDGFQEIKVALLQTVNGSLKAAILTQAGFSPGIDLGGLGGSFVIKRTITGDAVLEVGDQTETIDAVGLPGSNRPGVKTIEFGTSRPSAPARPPTPSVTTPPAASA